MEDKKYCMYIVNSDDDNFDKSIAGYDDIKNSAIDYTASDDLNDLLMLLISGLNNEEYSDQNWYFITDEIEGIVIMN